MNKLCEMTAAEYLTSESTHYVFPFAQRIFIKNVTHAVIHSWISFQCEILH